MTGEPYVSRAWLRSKTMSSSTRWTGVSIAMLTCARLPLPRSPLFVPPRRPRRCRDALEQRAVNGRPPASQQGWQRVSTGRWATRCRLQRRMCSLSIRRPPPALCCGPMAQLARPRKRRSMLVILGGIHAANASAHSLQRRCGRAAIQRSSCRWQPPSSAAVR